MLQCGACGAVCCSVVWDGVLYCGEVCCLFVCWCVHYVDKWNFQLTWHRKDGLHKEIYALRDSSLFTEAGTEEKLIGLQKFSDKIKLCKDIVV